MKCLENNISLRQFGYLLHDYIYRPVKLFQFKLKWLRYSYNLFDPYTGKPTVVYMSLINGGGLKKHLNDLVNGVKDNYDTWILYDDHILWHWKGDHWDVFRYKGMHLYEVLGYINPSVIHVHQLSRDLDELNTLLTSKSMIIVTIHDLYYVCPHFYMTECLGTKFCHPSSCSETWRQNMSRLLNKCCAIVCPSTAMRDILTFYYPEIEDKCVVIEHGIERTFHDD